MFNRRDQGRSFYFNPPAKANVFKKILGRFLALSTLIAFGALAWYGVSNHRANAPAERTLAYIGKNACEYRFEGMGVSLIQSHCEHNEGVYVMTTTGMMTAPLIDPSVQTLLDQHGCEAPNRCEFHLELGRDAVQGQFEYTINGQDGFYEFDWPRDDEPRLVKSSALSDSI
ncbi:MAG TPA: hypothetical protein VFV57_06675 [Limnobacter sp.]|nr:hypothetical protein [Limnobacter sp.]